MYLDLLLDYLFDYFVEIRTYTSAFLVSPIYKLDYFKFTKYGPDKYGLNTDLKHQVFVR